MSHLKNSLTLCLLSGAFLCSVTAQAAEVPTGVKLAKEQLLRYNNQAEPQTLDPQKMSDLYGSHIAADLFEGLLNVNQKNKANHGLDFGVAKSFDLSKDKKTYTFHLRKNAKWSNGSPLTAEDFVYSWRRAVDPATASPYATFLVMANIQNAQAVIDGKLPIKKLGVSAPDPHTFVVKLQAPVSYFPKMVTHSTFYPVPRKVIKKWGDKWTRAEHIVGNGAFILKKWVVNERMVLKRNPNYWDNQHTVLDTVEVLPIVDENSGVNRLMADQLEITPVPSLQIARIKAAAKKNTNIKVLTSPRLSTAYFTFNTDKAPFDDVRVRKALAYALNREAMANQVLKNSGYLPAYYFTPAATEGFVPPELEWSTLTQKERIEKAKGLLNEAGFNAEHPLEFANTTTKSPEGTRIAVAFAAMWKQAFGPAVKVTLDNSEWKTFLEKLNAKQYKVASMAWSADYNEPSTMLGIWTCGNSNNRTGWCNKNFDKLIDNARVSNDPKQRIKDYQQAEAILANEVPITPTYNQASTYLVRTQVGGFTPDPMGVVYHKDLYIKAKP